MCMVQGGDVVNNNGTGGESIYGEMFEDEDFSIKHDNPGMVGMMNSGPNSNQSQFYITTQPCYHLDDTNVVLGRVVKGFNTVVEMSDFPRENDQPLELMLIDDCGELKPGEPWNVNENDGTEDVYPPWPDDWDKDSSLDAEKMEKSIKAIKNSGKYYYEKKDYVNSERKYKKCLRYIAWCLQHKLDIDDIMEIRNILVMNLASVKLRRQKYKEAITFCSEVLKTNEHHVKALYRRAQASLALMDYDKALDDINTASRLLPSDKNIMEVLTEAKRIKLKYLKNEKNFYSKIFS